MTAQARFADKIVIVTGAASGIGRAVLARLVGEGAIATGVDVNEEGLKESVALAAATAGSGGRAHYKVGSIAEEDDVKRIVAEVVEHEGRLDVLINMAGVMRMAKTEEASLEQFMAVLNVNLVGTFLLCREALPHLMKSKGNIVNCASTSAYFGHPYMAAYSASKGGVAALTHALAWEYIRQGVRVNGIAPGGIITPLMMSVGANPLEGSDFNLFQHLAPVDGKFGQPDNVAGVVAMLASADGAHMTGEIVKIDGGVHN